MLELDVWWLGTFLRVCRGMLPGFHKTQSVVGLLVGYGVLCLWVGSLRVVLGRLVGGVVCGRVRLLLCL